METEQEEGTSSNHVSLESAKTKVFKCKVCQIECKSKYALHRHSWTHKAPESYKCFLCEKSFNVKAVLLKHELTHTGVKPFQCELCPSKFSVKVSLVKHMLIHTGEKKFSCPTCSKKFTQNHHLKAHLMTHTGERPYECSVCNKTFARSSNLRLHQAIHKGDKISCDICGKYFFHKVSLQNHIRKHDDVEVFTCQKCGEKFVSINKLRSHLQAHSGSTSFECPTCKKMFKTKSRLEMHHARYKDKNCLNKEPKFVYTDIGITSLEKNQIDNEQQNIEQQLEGGKLPECLYCGKTFETEKKRRSHEKATHSGEPFSCFDCKKVFARKRTLKTHRLNHICLGKRFKCSLCDLLFAWKDSVIRHVRENHASDREGSTSESSLEKPFACNMCEENFSTERSYLWHKVSDHKSVEPLESMVGAKDVLVHQICNKGETFENSLENQQSSYSEMDALLMNNSCETVMDTEKQVRQPTDFECKPESLSENETMENYTTPTEECVFVNVEPVVKIEPVFDKEEIAFNDDLMVTKKEVREPSEFKCKSESLSVNKTKGEHIEPNEKIEFVSIEPSIKIEPKVAEEVASDIN